MVALRAAAVVLAAAV
jgi:hypothetical protein